MQTFLSYKRESEKEVQRIYDGLREWGYDPWMDVHRIPKGIDQNTITWMDAIDQGLRDSRVIIGCITSLALKSKNVRQEWVWALVANRRMIFLRLEPFRDTDMPHQFAGVNYIDFVDCFNDGMRELRVTLDNYAESPAASEPLKDVAWPSTQRVLAELDALAKFAPLTPKRDKELRRPDDESFAQLRDRVRRYWLEGSLRPGLEEVRTVGIPLSLNTQAVVRHREWTEDPVRHSLNIRTVYGNLRSFAILGAPGSGKTTVIMQLALDLLRDEALTSKVPFLLNLSSWRPDSSLRQWMLVEGHKTYRMSSKLIVRWLDDKRLILLLDGFDEVPEEHRRACIDAIKAVPDKRQSRKMGNSQYAPKCFV